LAAARAGDAKLTPKHPHLGVAALLPAGRAVLTEPRSIALITPCERSC